MAPYILMFASFVSIAAMAHFALPKWAFLFPYFGLFIGLSWQSISTGAVQWFGVVVVVSATIVVHLAAVIQRKRASK